MNTDLAGACEVAGIRTTAELFEMVKCAQEGKKALDALRADTLAAAMATVGPGTPVIVPAGASCGELLALRDHYRAMAPAAGVSTAQAPAATSAAPAAAAASPWAALTNDQQQTGLRMGFRTPTEQARFAEEVVKARGTRAA